MAPLPTISRRGVSLLVVLLLASVSVWYINLSASPSSWGISLPRLGVGQTESPGDEWDVFPVDDGNLKEGDNMAVDESVSKASDHLVVWSNGIPKTKVRAHVPGWTILDNVILANGTLFLVSDTPNDRKLPDLNLIMSHWKRPRQKDQDKSLPASPEDPTQKDIQVITSNAVHAMFGQSASKIQGVTWLCNHPSEFVDDYTFFSLYRTYSTLSSSANSDLPQPHRLILPRTLSTQKSLIPHLSLLPKLLFPSLTLSYAEDWKDYADTRKPFFLEQVLIADRGAAMRVRHEATVDALVSGDGGAHWDSTTDPVFSGPFNALPKTDPRWWEDVRRRLIDFLVEDYAAEDATTGMNRKRPVVTYLSVQDINQEVQSQQDRIVTPRLKPVDHDRLVTSLDEMCKTLTCELNLVDEKEWARMRLGQKLVLMGRSDIILGPASTALASSIWMTPTPNLSALIEFFHSAADFTRLHEFPIRQLGVDYIAWVGRERFDSPSYPRPSEQSHQRQPTDLMDFDPDDLINVIWARIEAYNKGLVRV